MSGLLLLDSASAYFRAFHGVPTTVTAPDGRPVNAIRGLLDTIGYLVETYRPAQLACCWDDQWRPDWRVALVPSYKAHRVAADGGEDAPDELEPQVPIIRELLTAVGLPIVGAADHEADDVIATLARCGVEAGSAVLVVTGDRDLFQLIREPAGGRAGVRVLYTGRGMARAEVLDDAAVRDRYGVPAACYAEMATLRGDTSDGLPGVAGIGDKTAARLLATFGSLAAVVDAAVRGDAALAPRVRAAVLDAAPRLPAMLQVVRTVDDLDRRGLLEPPFPPGGWPLPRTPADPDRFDDLVAANGLANPAARLLAALAGSPVDRICGSCDDPVMAIPVHGYAHIRLTVTDIDRSREFYDAIFGFPVAVELPADADQSVRDELYFLYGGVVYQLPGALFGLRPVAPGWDRFDENRVGLDHVSFAVESRTVLDNAVVVLAEQGVATPGIKDIGNGWILEFRDPDGVALELFAAKPVDAPAAAPA